MNCPFCHNPLDYEQVGNAYYRVRCPKEQCGSSEHQERLFIGFADDFPEKRVTDYSLFIVVDGIYYTFTSIEMTIAKPENNYSSIDYVKSPHEDPILLHEWDEWVPLQENLDPYLERIRRLAKLKAFW